MAVPSPQPWSTRQASGCRSGARLRRRVVASARYRGSRCTTVPSCCRRWDCRRGCGCGDARSVRAGSGDSEFAGAAATDPRVDLEWRVHGSPPRGCKAIAHGIGNQTIGVCALGIVARHGCTPCRNRSPARSPGLAAAMPEVHRDQWDAHLAGADAAMHAEHRAKCFSPGNQSLIVQLSFITSV
jgi:hypothetical protein